MDKIYAKKTKKIRAYEEKEDNTNVSTLCTEYECLCGKGKIITNRIPGFEFYINLKCPVCEEKYYSSVDLSGDDWVLYPRKKNNGSYKTRYHQTYSYKEETLYEKLHAYSSSNKDLIEESTMCYCFHCQKKMDSKEIENYLNEGNGTALCPYCGVDAILPDVIEEEINDEIIAGMNKYWF